MQDVDPSDDPEGDQQILVRALLAALVWALHCEDRRDGEDDDAVHGGHSEGDKAKHLRCLFCGDHVLEKRLESDLGPGRKKEEPETGYKADLSS